MSVEAKILYDNGNLPEAESTLFTLDTEPPVVDILALDLNVFSPDGDGNKDFVSIRQTSSPENLWEGYISDSANRKLTSWLWQGAVQDIKWYGRDSAGNVLPNGSYVYTLSGEDAAGNRTVRKLGPVVLDARSTPVSLSTDVAFFSPNGDRKKDSLNIRPVLEIRDGVGGWKLEILDSQKKVIRVFSGNGVPPSSIVFDGRTDQAKTAPDGVYQGILKVNYLKGNIATGYSPEFTIDTAPPQIAVNADILLFSPNGDGRKDNVQIIQSGSVEDQWDGTIVNSAGAVVWRQSWKGRPPTFSWSGKDTSGKTLPNGSYVYKVTGIDRADNTGSAQTAAIVLDNTATPVSVTSSVKSFSPNGDGVKDTASFTTTVSVPSGITTWFLSIMDDKGRPYKTFTGSKNPPSAISWKGEGADGRVRDGDYYAELTVEYDKGDVSRARTAGTFFIDITPPSISAVMSPLPFSPDGDGENDTLLIDMSFKDRSPISRWQVEIVDPYRKPFRQFSGTGTTVSRLSWNGRSGSDELVQSAEDYPMIITVEDDLGNKGRLEKTVPVDILVIKDGDRLKIIISSIYFKPYTAEYLDRTAIDPVQVEKNIATLNRLAEILKKYRDYSIRLEGHAVRIFWDDPARVSTEESDVLVPLSMARAAAIKKALVERGIKTERLTTFGYGGSQPVVPHGDLDNRWKNRRVEFILIK